MAILNAIGGLVAAVIGYWLRGCAMHGQLSARCQSLPHHPPGAR